MVVIDRISLIVIQFRFSPTEANALPPFIKSKGREMSKHLPFMSHMRGDRVFERIKNCSISALPADLARTKYRMVGATYAEHRDAKYVRVVEHVVTFTFVHGELADSYTAEPSPELKKWEDFATAEFKNLCCSALRELQAFSNPLYRDGKEVPNLRELRIDLSGNMPLTRPDGKPVLLYPRDEHGKVVGFGKPLKAAMNFTFVGNEFIGLERTASE